MNFNDLYPSRFLKAADVDTPQGLALTIDRTVLESMGEGQGDKPVIYFRDNLKGLVLNKTNGAMIAEMFGPDTDRWAGQRILLYKDVTMFQGKPTPTIRVRYIPPQPQMTQPAAAPAPDASFPFGPNGPDMTQPSQQPSQQQRDMQTINNSANEAF